MQTYHHQMLGDLEVNGQLVRGGFMPTSVPTVGFPGAFPGFTTPGAAGSEMLQRRAIVIEDKELQAKYDAVLRGDSGFDTNQIGQVLAQYQAASLEVNRGIVSTQTAFPARQNLEAPAVSLVPVDTPVRNMLPRIPGAGTAVAWKQLTSLGGGWGTGYSQPGGGSALQMFYAEADAPVEHVSVYADKSASYKLLGTLGSVSNFAAASGANFQDQVETEKQNQLTNLMLNEEYALLYGDKTVTAVPWGDGTNALAFDGLNNLVTTANGTPSAQVLTSVGAFTLAMFDAQITRIWNNGGQDIYVIMAPQEVQSLKNLLQATGSVQRAMITDQRDVTMGYRVTGYVHPISGEIIKIITSKFQLAGEILFGSLRGPKGTPSAVVNVLPQVPVPMQVESPQQIQGYVVTMLAHSITQPDINPFLISVYEVLELRNALVWGKAKGVTAV